jgi:hypothetical protein
MMFQLKKEPMYPNDRVEAELPAGCLHSPIKVSLRRVAKLQEPGHPTPGQASCRMFAEKRRSRNQLLAVAYRINDER